MDKLLYLDSNASPPLSSFDSLEYDVYDDVDDDLLGELHKYISF